MGGIQIVDNIIHHIVDCIGLDMFGLERDCTDNNNNKIEPTHLESDYILLF